MTLCDALAETLNYIEPQRLHAGLGKGRFTAVHMENNTIIDRE